MNDFTLARRYLFRGKAKHVSFIGIFSCLGIVIGVASIIVALSIFNGVDGGLMERIMRFKPHLIVESEKEDVLRRVRDAAASYPEVTMSSLSLQTQVFAKFKDTIVPLIVKGAELDRQKDFFGRYILSEAGPDGFYAGRELIRRYGIKNTIEFYPLQKKLESKTMPLRGIFRVGLYDVDNFYLITDLKAAKELSPNYSLVLELQIKDPYAVDKVKEKIRSQFNDVYVSTWIDTNQALFATLKMEKFAMYLILGLIVLVASFNMFAMMTVKVVEKTRDIGVMKALGYARARVLRVFALQGVTIGIIGTGLGAGLGLGICHWLKQYPVIKMPAEIFFNDYLPVMVQRYDVIMVCLVALVISFIASLFPAIRASHLETCEALRYE
jgi:lipoprotein-releasing system permease protein